LILIFCSLHHTALSHRLSKLKSVESKAKSQYKKCLEKSQADNTQVRHTSTDITCSL